MIIVMKPSATEEDIATVKRQVEANGVVVDQITGTQTKVLGLVGDVTTLDSSSLLANEAIDKILRVSEPFKRASRTFHPEATVVDVEGVQVGEKG